jgi:hypothetical protein
MDVPASMTVASDAQTPLAGAISGHDTEAGGLIPKPHDFEGVGRKEVCGLLIGQLQDVSVHLCCVRCLAV